MEMKNKLLSGIILLVILINIAGILAQSSSTESEFYNTFAKPYCYAPNAFESFWIYENKMDLSMTQCYNVEGIPTANCCPIVASICNTNKCEPGPQYCANLTKEQCKDLDEGYPIIAASDLETDQILSSSNLVCNTFSDNYGEQGCYNYLACQCEWDETNGCEAVAEHQIYDGRENIFYDEDTALSVISDFCGAGTPVIGKCKFSFNLVDNCDTLGFLNRGWVTNWIGDGVKPDYCNSGEDRIPCLDVVKLGFFNVLNLIIAVIVIALIYTFIKIKKR